jgi:hypothetical protein
MWNKPKEVIASSRDIANEHLRILEKAANDADEFAPHDEAVRKALNYITAHSDRKGGVSLFLLGLREADAQKLRDGVALMRRQVCP